jgi:hypothetical protein
MLAQITHALLDKQASLNNFDDGSVRFCAAIGRTAVAREGRLVRCAALGMSNGEWILWAGTFDRLRLKEFAKRALPAANLACRLIESGLRAHQAKALIDWCLRHGVLCMVHSPRQSVWSKDPAPIQKPQ